MKRRGESERMPTGRRVHGASAGLKKYSAVAGKRGKRGEVKSETRTGVIAYGPTIFKFGFCPQPKKSH